jgi:hypothetical protein
LNASGPRRTQRIQQLLSVGGLDLADRVAMVAEYTARRLTGKERDEIADWRSLVPLIPGTAAEGPHFGPRAILGSIQAELKAKLSTGLTPAKAWANEGKLRAAAAAKEKQAARAELEPRLAELAEVDEAALAEDEAALRALDEENGAKLAEAERAQSIARGSRAGSEGARRSAAWRQLGGGSASNRRSRSRRRAPSAKPSWPPPSPSWRTCPSSSRRPSTTPTFAAASTRLAMRREPRNCPSRRRTRRYGSPRPTSSAWIVNSAGRVGPLVRGRGGREYDPHGAAEDQQDRPGPGAVAHCLRRTAGPRGQARAGQRGDASGQRRGGEGQGRRAGAGARGGCRGSTRPRAKLRRPTWRASGSSRASCKTRRRHTRPRKLPRAWSTMQAPRASGVESWRRSSRR